MWRRVRSVSIAARKAVDGPPVAPVPLLAQEAADADDSRGADAGTLVDLAIRQLTRIEQPGDVPALSHGPDLRRRAQVDQQVPHLHLALGREKCIAQVVGQ